MDLYDYYSKFVKARHEIMHLRFRQKMQWGETISEGSFVFQTSPFYEIHVDKLLVHISLKILWA